MVVRQSLLSLSSFAVLDYLGPKIRDKNLQPLINKIYTLKHQSSCSGKLKMLTKGITSGYYESWLSKSAGLNWDAYDLVYLEYTRYGFIARQAKKKLKKLIIRVHNVEKDYYENRVTIGRSLSNYLRLLIKRNLITKQESICLGNADCIVCLTAADSKRLTALYPAETDGKRIAVVPVALEHAIPPGFEHPSPCDDDLNKPYLLITGSLWFGPNSEGATWFIKNVWLRLLTDNHYLSREYELVIAGSRAGQELRTLVSRHSRIRLFDSPVNIKPYFEAASIYLAPIFSGAGMKVKVAEALSYGLPVIGTSHALRGYQIIDGENSYCADDATQFIDALDHYTGMPDEDKILMKKKAYQLFLDDHSIEKSKIIFQDIMLNL